MSGRPILCCMSSRSGNRACVRRAGMEIPTRQVVAAVTVVGIGSAIAAYGEVRRGDAMTLSHNRMSGVTPRDDGGWQAFPSSPLLLLSTPVTTSAREHQQLRKPYCVPALWLQINLSLVGGLLALGNLTMESARMVMTQFLLVGCNMHPLQVGACVCMCGSMCKCLRKRPIVFISAGVAHDHVLAT